MNLNLSTKLIALGILTVSNLSFGFYRLSQPSNGTSGGDPIEVRSTQNDPMDVYEATSSTSDRFNLHSFQSLGLSPKTYVKRIEVRAAGQGRMAVFINGQRITEYLDLKSESDFQMYSFPVNLSLPDDRDALFVQIVVFDRDVKERSSESKILLGKIRFFNTDVIVLRPNSSEEQGYNTPNTINNSSRINYNGKLSCRLEPGLSAQGWDLFKSNSDIPTFHQSPELLLKDISSTCRPLFFRCDVVQLKDKFAVAVVIRDQVVFATGSLSLKDATLQIEKYRKIGLCKN